MDQDDDRAGQARVSDQIDANLKRVYREIVGDDVPDRFRQLLDQLRNQGDDGAEAPAADEDAAARASGGGRA